MMFSLLWILNAQAQVPWIDTVDTELQLAQGAGGVGAWGRANHTWTQGSRWSVQSGLALGLYGGSEGREEGPILTEGAVFDSHLQIHSGLMLHTGSRHTVYTELGLYGGGYVVHTSGEWRHTELDLTQHYSTTALLPDVGFRWAIGLSPRQGWGVQLTLTDSLRQLGSNQGVFAGLITMDADAKLVLGVGLRFQRGAP